MQLYLSVEVSPLRENGEMSESHLRTGDVHIDRVGGFQMPAYQAYPEWGGDRFPIVLFVEEIFGLDEHIKDICRRRRRPAISQLLPNSSRGTAMSRKCALCSGFPRDVVGWTPDEQVMLAIDTAADWATCIARAIGDRPPLGV